MLCEDDVTRRCCSGLSEGFASLGIGGGLVVKSFSFLFLSPISEETNKAFFREMCCDHINGDL